MEEKDYIARSIKGEANAQRMLFKKYSALMLKVCQRYLKDPFESEEAFIQAFKKAFDHLETFEERNDQSFKNWLTRIMINECLMLLRKSHRFEKVQEDYNLLTAAEHHTSDSEYIYQLILDLPLGYRTIFNLFVIEGYSHAEIAEMLNISEGTSRSQLSKAREILKKKIKIINDKNGTY